MPFSNFTTISAYSRKQAIEDGVLIDITAAATDHGFKLHTVVTDNLYHAYLNPPDDLVETHGQSLDGRLHDMLHMAYFAAKKSKGQSRIEFEVLFLMAPGKHEKVTVIAQVGPGDDPAPVLTLMLPGDD
jgi:hypothetical protein